jgi:membrane protease YdiL (CAAX protease family)
MHEDEISAPTNSFLPSWRWSDLVWIVLGILAIFFVGFFLLGSWLGLTELAPGETLQPTLEQSLALAGLETIALVLAVYFLGMRRRGISWVSIGLRDISWRWIGIVTVITVIAIPLTGLLTILVLLALDLPLENPQLDFLIPEGFSWLSAVGMLLLGGVTAPFGEELIFRGVLYPLLRNRWGLWPGVLSSSLIFAVVHGDIAVGVSAFVLGIILALVFEYSRSLWSSVLVHVLNNGLKILLLYILVALGFSTELGF